MTLKELNADVTNIRAWRGGVDEKMDGICTRLDHVEANVKEQGKLLQSLDRLAMGLSRLDEKMGDLSCKLDNFGGRISLIELKPATKWEQAKWLILTVLITAGLTVLITKLIG
jgi:hypothetical protein